VKPWVNRSRKFQAQDGRQKICLWKFLSPIRGFIRLGVETHGYTVGYFLQAPPAVGLAGFEARANGRKMFEQVSSTMRSQRD
jgi:hypothetical protein